MKHIITGGAGFIGSHLASALVDGGHEVEVVDNLSTGKESNIPKGVELIHADVSDRWWVARCDPDVVWHLASPCSPPVYMQHRTHTLLANSLGTMNALNVAEKTFVLASTSEVYGDPQVSPQSESYWGNVNPVGPRSCYDEGKRFAEALTVAHRHENDDGPDVHIARIFNTYGPGMVRDGRVMMEFITAALSGQPLVVLGDGFQTRSFTYISDTVDGLLALSRSDVDVCNIGKDDELTINHLAHLVVNTLNSKSEIVHWAGTEDDPTVRRPDTFRLNQRLGRTPNIELADGITRTAEWVERHGE